MIASHLPDDISWFLLPGPCLYMFVSELFSKSISSDNFVAVFSYPTQSPANVAEGEA